MNFEQTQEIQGEGNRTLRIATCSLCPGTGLGAAHALLDFTRATTFQPLPHFLTPHRKPLERDNTVPTVSLPIHSFTTVKVTSHLPVGNSTGRHITTSFSMLYLLATFDRADHTLLESLKGWFFSGYFIFLIGFISTQSCCVSLPTRMQLIKDRDSFIHCSIQDLEQRLEPLVVG